MTLPSPLEIVKELADPPPGAARPHPVGKPWPGTVIGELPRSEEGKDPEPTDIVSAAA